MKLFQFCLCWLVLLLLAHSTAAQEAGKFVSIVGKSEVFQDGQWQQARIGQGFSSESRIRTGPGSRLAIFLADGSQIKVNANSTLELKQVVPSPAQPTPAAAGVRPLRTLISLFSGEMWARSRGQPLEVQTPTATASIRGTELNLSVSRPAESRLAVLEGVVAFYNPHGSVTVAAGEQATATAGEAPRKTVLVNPLDAVQWSLYYPVIVSLRDFPLTDIPPSLLLQRSTAAEQRVAAAPKDAEANAELGEILFDLGRQGEARRAFESALALSPQSPRAHSGLGWVKLVDGQAQAALDEFRQVSPPTRSALVGAANALYRLGRIEEAAEVIAEARRRFPSSPQPLTQAAFLHLTQGRVSEALEELRQALTLDPGYALAYGLLSNIYLVQNQKKLALEAAQQAITVNPRSPSAHLDLSLVRQAEFQLEEALQEARKAVELDPQNAHALIQVSRLLFGMGRLTDASKIAEQARRLAPQDPLVNTTWGFLLLAYTKVREAIEAFDRAIQADSTLGEPRLGRGLALFRQGSTAEAVQEILISTLLEPQVSLFHSYLGKALYEVKRDQEANEQFARAKDLDPRDPTPWFYNAIAKQTANRPVDALHDLQQAIELNDNRAVYRSRLLLDADLAARSASLGRIYGDLGFQQLALVEGWKSVNTDPTNFSAHRFLADSYAVLPRHEIARVSELLQSQLLQPINLTPIQPRLAVSNLFLINAQGPGTLSFNEFNPLFDRNRLALQATGLGATNNTWGGEGTLSGIADKTSFSLGYNYFATDGFRINSDQKDNIFDAFFQQELTPNTSIQAEFRYRNLETGDLLLRFFPEDIFPGQRNTEERYFYRLGGRHTFSPDSLLLGSLSYQHADSRRRDARFPQLGVRFANLESPDEQAFGGEFQHLFRSRYFNLASGVGYINVDGAIESTVGFGPPRSRLPVQVSSTTDTQVNHANTYAYAYINVLENVTFTVGASFDSLSGDFPGDDTTQFNPKFGIIWNPFPGTTVRAAAFRVLKRTLITDQTLEPTQVSGFNQFFDDLNLTNAWRYGVALDQKFTQSIFGGVEISKRDLMVPFLDFTVNPANPPTREADWNEFLARTYFFWTPHPWLALRTEYAFERLERDNRLPLGVTEVDTHRVPLGISFFHPSGLSTSLTTTYFNQGGDFGGITAGTPIRPGSDNFWTVDVAINYRLSKRYGFITVGATNLFNEHFNFFENDLRNASIQPTRTVFGRITLAFP